MTNKYALLLGPSADKFQAALDEYGGEDFNIEDYQSQNETSPRFRIKIGGVIVYTVYTKATEKINAAGKSPSKMGVGFGGELEKIVEARDKLEGIFDIKLEFMDEYSNADTI